MQNIHWIFRCKFWISRSWVNYNILILTITVLCGSLEAARVPRLHWVVIGFSQIFSEHLISARFEASRSNDAMVQAARSIFEMFSTTLLPGRTKTSVKYQSSHRRWHKVTTKIFEINSIIDKVRNFPFTLVLFFGILSALLILLLHIV